MNRDDFEAWFKSTGVPALNRFHQATTDAMGNRIVFWTVMAAALIGMVTIVRWVL